MTWRSDSLPIRLPPPVLGRFDEVDRLGLTAEAVTAAALRCLRASRRPGPSG